MVLKNKKGLRKKKLVMDTTSLNMHEKFIFDKDGNKEEVILKYKEYQELIEDYFDLLAMLEAKKDPPVPWEDIKKQLEVDGIL